MILFRFSASTVFAFFISLLLGADVHAADCNLPSVDNVKFDLSEHEGRKELSFEGSSEGGSLVYYRDDERLIGVEATYFGVIGKIEIIVLPVGDGNYSARIGEFTYSAPMYASDMAIVAIHTTVIQVCAGEIVRGTANSDVLSDMEEAYRMVTKLIEEHPKILSLQ